MPGQHIFRRRPLLGNDEIRVLAADFVLYASPLYCWGFTSQIKAFIDRHYCLVKGYGTPECKSLINGKPIALLVTCGGPIEGNADLIQEMFERFSGYGQCKVVGKYIVPFSMDPNAFPAQGMETAAGTGYRGADNRPRSWRLIFWPRWSGSHIDMLEPLGRPFSPGVYPSARCKNVYQH